MKYSWFQEECCPSDHRQHMRHSSIIIVGQKIIELLTYCVEILHQSLNLTLTFDLLTPKSIEVLLDS